MPGSANFLFGKAVQAAALYGVAFLFGGGGSGAGFANLVVQVFALGLLMFNADVFVDFFQRAPRYLSVLVAATLTLPLFQSIPLPPAVWGAMPGRDLVQSTYALLGLEGAWHPMSLEVRRTMIAFFALVPAVTMLVLAWDLPEQDRKRLLMLIVATGLGQILIGLPQLVTGNERFVFYAEARGTSDLQGVFANRNSAGLFLDAALCALVGVFPWHRSAAKWRLACAGIALILLVGLVLTRSRSSMALSLVPLCLGVVCFMRRHGKISLRALLLAATVGSLVLGGGAFMLAKNARIENSLGRFETLDDHRPLIWEDAIGSVKHFWPVGSGIGTFDEVFQIDETLENIRPGRAARAHNEYLELALESGAIGVALALGWFGYLLLAARKAWLLGGSARVSIAFMLLVALQSVLDYPLRNQALLCLAGLMLALVVRPCEKKRRGLQLAGGEGHAI